MWRHFQSGNSLCLSEEPLSVNGGKLSWMTCLHESCSEAFSEAADSVWTSSRLWTQLPEELFHQHERHYTNNNNRQTTHNNPEATIT